MKTTSMHLIRLAVAAALLLCTATAVASSPLLRDEAMTAEAFADAAARIEQAMATGAYRRLSGAERAAIGIGLRRIAGYLATGQADMAALARNEQVRINALLAPAHVAGNTSEVICRRVKVVGTNIPSTECHRRNALEAHSRDVQNELLHQAEFAVGGPRIDERGSTIQGRNYGRD